MQSFGYGAANPSYMPFKYRPMPSGLAGLYEKREKQERDGHSMAYRTLDVPGFNKLYESTSGAFPSFYESRRKPAAAPAPDPKRQSAEAARKAAAAPQPQEKARFVPLNRKNFSQKELNSALTRLELTRGATLTNAKKAFRKLALVHHPDKGGKEEDFKKISNAWEYLQEANRLHHIAKGGTRKMKKKSLKKRKQTRRN